MNRRRTRGTEQDSHHLFETPLYLAGLRDDATDIVQTLIDAGADVEAKTNYGRPFLQFAFESNNIEMVKVLLSAEPDLDARDDRYGWSLLHLAASRGNFKAVQSLIEAGANPMAMAFRGETPLHRAGNFETVRILLDAGADLSARTRNGSTPLHYAGDRYVGNSETTKALLDAGASPNAQAMDGRTPLHHAGNSETIRMLLDAGVDLNAQMANGHTALHLARNSEAVRLGFDSCSYISAGHRWW